MLKEMVIRDENSLEQLKIPCPIVLDVHGELGTRFQMFDDKRKKEVSSFIGIGVEGEKLFQYEDGNMDVLAAMIKHLLE